jgi:protein TonB
MMTKKRTHQLARAKLIIALPVALSLLVLISFSPDMIAQEKVKDPPPPPPQPQEVSADKAEVKKEPKVIKMVEYQDEEPVFTVVEVMPKFPGGNKALYTYLGNNIKYPDVAKKEGIEGTVYVTYVIEKDGSVTHVKLLRGVHESLDKEALRVVQEMPKWEPGKEKGKPVRVQYSLPIKYTLAKDKEKEKDQNP